MDERRPIIIFSDQKEEQLLHDMSLLCSRMQKGQLLKASALALYPIYNHLNIYKKRLTLSVLWAFVSILSVLVSCGDGRTERPSDRAAHSSHSEHADSAAVVDLSGRGREMGELLSDFDRQHGKRRTAAAQPVFDLLYREEMTDSLLKAAPGIPADSLDMLVWYWAAEYLYETQDYAEGLRCATRALPLTYRSCDLQLQSDCERLLGLFHFRLSDYVQAIEHTRKSLEIGRKGGDMSRISSSLNTLAGICLVAKQLDDGERYILEAIRYSTAAGDSNRVAIQYGMASEIYHIMGKPQQALAYARRACEMDEARGNTAKVGIRLSQMAAAQMALGQDTEAERSLMRAIPILEKAGNRQSLSICRNQTGELLNRRGAHEEAARYFRQAVDEFAARKDMYNESRARMGLYEALKGTNPAEAGQHLLRYATLKDSIYHHDMEQNVSSYNVRYKTEELALQQARERAEKRVILIGSIALIAVLLLIVITLIYMGKVRRRNHRLLKQVSRLREDFFTNITHEFRTPLTLILGLSHELQQSPTDSPAKIYDKAKTIERQGNGLLTLINQLLDISKIKSAVGNTDWRSGNISAYLAMIVESYRDFARSRNINLQFFSKGEVEMDFVPDYAVKVMNNLLSNAFKFTPAYGKVSVLVWRESDRLRIDVSDTGDGIDQEQLKHLFEPFYQGKSHAQHVGTGVGLALVKQIMDAVEGWITVESASGQGTTFHISVPIRHHGMPSITTATEQILPLLPEVMPDPQDSDSEDNACRLLIIEDNADVAAYIGAQFADRYALSYATDGAAGLEKAFTLVPDLIITDLMMPGMDGLDVCRQIRGNEIVNHIPIIVVTAKITEEERIKGIEAGADAYLAKPFNSDELRTRVEKLLESRRLLQEKFAKISLEIKENEKQDLDISQEADLRFLAKVSDFVYRQLSQNQAVDVSTVSSVMCMSPRQLHRKINALTGYAPSAYIQRLKIRKARNLLDKDFTISFMEVADQCGFDAYPNFVRAFKNVCGVTPTEYRRRDN